MKDNRTEFFFATMKCFTDHVGIFFRYHCHIAVSSSYVWIMTWICFKNVHVHHIDILQGGRVTLAFLGAFQNPFLVAMSLGAWEAAQFRNVGSWK